MAKIKHIQEDFIVNEITNVKQESNTSNNNKFTYFWLTKKNCTTNAAIEKIAAALNKPLKSFGYAGNKDKRAVTTQLCSVNNIGRSVGKEALERLNKKLSTSDITTKFYGYGNKPISLGDLQGNKFVIAIRDNTDKEIKNVTKKLGNKKKFSIINYFDEQRFAANNVEIGKFLVKKHFKQAAELIASESSSYNKNSYNENVKYHLEKKPNDAAGALRLIPKKILLMFINSYQSWLFNEMAALYIEQNYKPVLKVPYSEGLFVFPKKKIRNIKLPIIGFGTQINGTKSAKSKETIETKKIKKIEDIAEKLLSEEHLTPRDFIIPQIPELSSEGTERSMIVDVTSIGYQVEDDEFFKNKKKIILSFTLPKGSYATIVVKYLIGL